MNPTILRTSAASFILAAALGLASCNNDDMSGMPSMGSSSAPADPSTSASAIPSTSGTPATGAYSEADVMFAQMMIPHHQQAVGMSDLILAKESIDPQVTQLAQEIKDAQSPEISRMSGWLAGWGASANPSMGMDHDMGDGMMSQADMDELEQATGPDATMMFLEGMTEHHKGAIAMAQDELRNGENAEARDLAQDIITAQEKEIDAMEQLLADL